MKSAKLGEGRWRRLRGGILTGVEQASLQRRHLSKGLKEMEGANSRGRTFQTKRTRTKAMKQEYALLRITYKETN